MLSATTARLASICSHYSAPFWGKASPNCSDHLLRPTSRLMDCRGLQDGAQQSGAQRGAHGNGQLIHHSFGLHSLSHPKPSRPLAGLEKYQPKRGRHVATQRCCASATWYAKEWYAAWYARKRTFCVLLRAHCVRTDLPSRLACGGIDQHEATVDASFLWYPRASIQAGIHKNEQQAVPIWKPTTRANQYGAT